MQKSTVNVLVSPKYRALYGNRIKESNDDVRTVTELHKWPFLRMRSENRAKNCPKCCQIAKI